MNSRIPVLVLLACAALAGNSARASAPISSGQESVRVEIPRSGLNWDESSTGAPRADGLRAELAASSWTPGDLELGSLSADATSFRARGLPSLSASVLLDPWRLRGGDLSLKAGLGFTTLQRDGTIPGAGGNAEQVNQSLYLIPLTLGAEFVPAVTRWKPVELHASAALAPTLLLTERSALANGESALGLPVLLSVGADSDLRWVTLTVDLVTTLGHIDGGNLAGTGVSAGFQVSM